MHRVVAVLASAVLVVAGTLAGAAPAGAATPARSGATSGVGVRGIVIVVPIPIHGPHPACLVCFE